MRRLIALLPILAIALAPVAPAQETPYQPKRVNKVIELFEQSQPAYYTGSHEGTGGGFEQGKLDAQTWADYINYDMEAAPWDVASLAEYMKGLVAGGPTKSGHRTPAVIVVLPVRGTDAASIRANAWMVEQVLATGVHGILLAHATTGEALRTLIETVRYPNSKPAAEGLGDGLRGAHGASSAARIWGVSGREYQQKADVWPLNPEGEILIGVKIEDKYAIPHLDDIVRVPGLAFGEGGPGDMGLSLGLTSRDPEMVALQAKIFSAAKAQKLYWLGVSGNDLEGSIGAGRMIGSGEKTAIAGRAFTKREMPF